MHGGSFAGSQDERQEKQMAEVTTGDGYAVGSLDGLGEGPGFRKIRRGLDVKEFGINAIVMPPHYASGKHYHDEQEELYFVHSGKLEFAFGDGSTHELEAGGLARVDASTVREVRNNSDEEAVYVIVGGKGGYVGRDGRLPEGEDPEAAQRGRALN
jgi:quercetin dioxygenase-like cupin family protein